MAEQTTTKHTCCPPGRGPGFRRTPGCPRCAELDTGAPPREAVMHHRDRRAEDAQRLADLHEHFGSEKHRTGGCGIVCTFGDW